MASLSEQNMTALRFREPEATVICFFNSLFGPIRNWARAYSCLGAEARSRFDSEHGLQSFADYWDDTLSLLDDLVKKRHIEFPYTHRSCFVPDRIDQTAISENRASFEIELLENHVSPERLTIIQTKDVSKHEGNWLLVSGELEGNLDEVIVTLPRRPNRRR